ncbi:NADP-dependent oxidoreductase domain-containing protein [Suillus bovinus]|uniref:NADP-dependent oxidoreductase domain-containing protein n=1 Tax=Suillus bovinus TaxID=48563 RepID=UPI001B885172|nr:NADP-dependent oxidoreductase domain-containing protein [Suillus bovinus]KAG2133184.1 NADP-dependent oxidoreductase domain-containing protein [Suillus bovinus]
MSFSQKYHPLLTVDKDTGEQESLQCRDPRKRRSLLVIAVIIIMFTSLPFVHMIRSRGFWGACHGSQRNSSTLAKLPSHYTLPSGDNIPSVALGVWQAGKGEVGNAVKTALTAGYRHIDGAWIYCNEEEVGQALKTSSIPCEELWLTSKLWNTFHAPEDIETALDQSLSMLGTNYLDLYLIHWGSYSPTCASCLFRTRPVAFKTCTTILDGDLTADPYPTWQKLEELVDKGKIRYIVISNFNTRRIKNLTANNLKYQPAVNQVELNFWNPQPELLKLSKENGLLLEAYSPLGSDKQVGKSLSVPEVKSITSKLRITPAQVIISWSIQRSTIVLPKSITPSRITENLEVFELPQEDFERLEKAATSHTPQRVVNLSAGWKLPFDVFDGQ